MLEIKVNRNQAEPVTIKAEIESADELRDEILMLATALIAAAANTADTKAEKLHRALIARNMLNMGALGALDTLCKEQTAYKERWRP